ncbi:hypothetical protein [Anaeromyxobacter oryzisoli]|jgi:hypothetical protein|uniref:hypothetical protein n=1 Tax=Anaeromyxobacter oryzisoli TaxID=2925408 RepID=UPI001F56C7DF|nr:hypothetical protein [Anaeromyxobacter sp. SG63]
MLRAAGWTIGLFGVGMIICQLYPTSWIEPVVLFGLGVALLAVSARTGVGPRKPRAVAPKEAAA